MGKAIRRLAGEMRRFGKNAAPTGPSTGPAHGAMPKDASKMAGLARENRFHHRGNFKGKSV